MVQYMKWQTFLLSNLPRRRLYQSGHLRMSRDAGGSSHLPYYKHGRCRARVLLRRVPRYRVYRKQCDDVSCHEAKPVEAVVALHPRMSYILVPEALNDDLRLKL